MRGLRALAAIALLGVANDAPTPDDFRADAVALAPLVAANYAYLDDLPGGVVPASAALDAQRDAVRDQRSLLRYAEAIMAKLADHHAGTARSFVDDWALVPTYADLWIERDGRGFAIDAVRPETPAARAGIAVGDRLTAIDGDPIDVAIGAFWAPIGLARTVARDGYAARVMVAGRRDRARRLTVIGRAGARTLTLPSLYSEQREGPPVTMTGSTIRINNALGDQATVAAFDAAMATIPRGRPVTIDLTETPSGGNTSVARAMMGWFVTRPAAYQIHELPAEERETGVRRRWIEQVLPRPGRYHRGRVTVRVGRWTGSMGEGLAAGFAAIGARVCGTPMAGLKGAIHDFDLPRTALRVKFPAERLYTVGGLPRERIVPRPC